MNHPRHPYQAGCPLCSLEYQRNARGASASDWRRVDSIQAMCLLTTIVLVACGVLVAAVKFTAVMP